MSFRFPRYAAALLLGSAAFAAEPAVRTATRLNEIAITSPARQPAAYRYTAFPSLLAIDADEVWVVYKAGKSHATDAGAALEVVRHSLSRGTTELIQRLPAPPPKLYQMGELTRLPDGTIAIYVDVQSVGWDDRRYRSGAEVFRWNAAKKAFDAPALMDVVDGVRYGYPFDFITEGRTTWQLNMAFGYMQGGRWSVDALRSEDAGRTWSFVRNLTAEFGGIEANESGFVRDGDGFLVTTRGYDKIERLHRTDGAFRVKQQVVLTGRAPFINGYIGRPRIFIRDGHGYIIGRNWTRPATTGAGKESTGPMQLCLIRFNLDTLVPDACVVLDNADNQPVNDGYYAVTAFSGTGADTRLHVITYKALGGEPPGIVRFDYRWADVK
ncbi:MAG: hypothetical protein NTV51_14930 [Verrucomicrobia bacterium]|nr:hypothetical protein [Verrucomicrobiota bacterium]